MYRGSLFSTSSPTFVVCIPFDDPSGIFKVITWIACLLTPNGHQRWSQGPSSSIPMRGNRRGVFGSWWTSLKLVPLQNKGDMDDSTHTVTTPSRIIQITLDVMPLNLGFPSLILRTFSDFGDASKRNTNLTLKSIPGSHAVFWLILLLWWRSTCSVWGENRSELCEIRFTFTRIDGWAGDWIVGWKTICQEVKNSCFCTEFSEQTFYDTWVEKLAWEAEG